jgi:hypothetical protein
MKMTNARSLDDSGLIVALKRLAGSEREATVALINHLAEFDRRQLYREAGFRSSFQYCVEVLRLSEDAAWNRIAAARMARKYPEVMEMLTDGRLSPTTARLIAKRMTPENHRLLLDTASGRTRRQVEEFLTALFPEPQVVASIRPVGPARAPFAASSTTSNASSAPAQLSSAPANVSSSPAPMSDREALAARREERSTCPTSPCGSTGATASVSPDSATPAAIPPIGEYEVKFPATAEMVEKLRLAQDLLSHAVRPGDLAKIFDRALTALVEQLLKQKAAVTEAPRKGPDEPSTAEKPAAVRRAVYADDDGRCTYVSADGRRCNSRRYLQFDHVVAKASGGRFERTNVRLLCGPHNRLMAERTFGTEPGARHAGGTVTRPGTGAPTEGP